MRIRNRAAAVIGILRIACGLAVVIATADLGARFAYADGAVRTRVAEAARRAPGHGSQMASDKARQNGRPIQAVAYSSNLR
jgi:hypothetical protein